MLLVVRCSLLSVVAVRCLFVVVVSLLPVGVNCFVLQTVVDYCHLLPFVVVDALLLFADCGRCCLCVVCCGLPLVVAVRCPLLL